ncbi:MAG TPA: O-antigen ligase family protein [Acidimicrobiia bacterium]|nr:O-antigen ligase family protein [Acidimicrobiia bacterium]
MRTVVATFETMRERPAVVRAAAVAAVVLGSVVTALMLDRGQWFLVVGLALAVPAVLLFHRNPLLALGFWLALGPVVQVVEAGGTGRKMYWLFHRGLPVLILGLIVVARLAGVTRRKLTLGWVEFLMAGYLIAAILSIQFTSPDVLATSYHLYDRVAIPMALFLLVRWYPPGRRNLEAAVPIVAFVLAVQLVAGVMQWFAPDLVPGAWLGRAGSRTTGSLRHPNVYGVVVLAAGAFLFHMGHTSGRGKVPRWVYSAAFAISVGAAFLTLSRATWLAALLALAVMAFLHPAAVRRMVVAMVSLSIVVVLSTPVEPVIERAMDRFYSDQSRNSALSRLPVVLASLRMFEAKPVAGWGFGNFDLYDRDFHGRVGDLFVPDRDEASHNIYLTILAEQGLIGILLYLGPAIVLLAKTPAAWRRLPRDGPLGRKFLVVLWLTPAMHFVVNNFSNMRIPFGLGVYWLTLGLIAGIVLPPRVRADEPRLLEAIGLGRLER